MQIAQIFSIHITMGDADSPASVQVFKRTGEQKETIGEQHTLNLQAEINDEFYNILDQLNSKEPRLTSAQLTKLGQALYGTIFTPQLSEALGAARASIRADDAVRFELRIDSALGNAYPWEAMHNGRTLLSSDMPFVRSLNLEGIQRQQREIRGKLRVLFVGASPREFPPLVIDDLAKNLITLIEQENNAQGRFDRRGVEIEVCNRIDATQLRDIVSKKTYHVLCFAGHGDSNSIILEQKLPNTPPNEAGYAQYISTANLATIIEDSSIQLVFLAACRTAETAQDAAAEATFGDFAVELARTTGIPAIIAMRTRVGQQPATRMTAAFFQQIARFQPIDKALMEARKQYVLSNGINRDSLAPILYLQSDRSDLFARPLQYLRYLAIFLFTLVVVLGIGNGVQRELNRRALEQQRLQSAAELFEEQRIRSETLFQVARAETRFPAAAIPDNYRMIPPTLVNRNLWVADATQQWIQSFDLTGQPTNPPLPLDAAPGKITVHDGNLWVLGASLPRVWRIDPITHNVTKIDITGQANNLLAADGLYAQSLVSNVITHIDPTTNATTVYRTGNRATEAVVAADAVWYTQRDELIRLHWDREQIAATRYPGVDDMELTVLGDDLFGTAGASLYLIETDTGTVKGQLELGAAVQKPILADGAIWLAAVDESTVFRVSQSGELTQISLPGIPQAIHAAPTRLWLPLIDDRIAVVDTTTATYLTDISIPGSALLDTYRPAIYDGTHTWFTVPSLDTVTIVDDSGNVFRQFSPCIAPTAPVYDGTNMWFTCEEGLVSIPARLTQVPIVRPNTDPTNHVTLVDKSNGVIWLVQEADRQIRLLDATTLEVLDTQNLNGTPHPLYEDFPYVWTATAGSVHRLQLSEDGQNIIMDNREIAGEVYDILRAEDHIWFLQTVFNDLAEGQDVAIIQRDTLQSTQLETQIVSSGIAYIDGVVWLSTSDQRQGYITGYDPVTLEPIEEPQKIPDTPLASWAPVKVGDKLWFTAGAAPAGIALEAILDLSGDNQPAFDRAIFSYDPTAMTWTGDVYGAPTYPLAPQVDGTHLWYALTELPSISSISQPEKAISGVWGIDVASGDTYGPFSICNGGISSTGIVGRYLYIGCYGTETSVATLDLDQQCIVHRYESVGGEPSGLVEHAGLVWISYEDTDNVAVFDANTGRLLRSLKMGRRPQQPFVLNDYIWVYNAGEGSLQRIAPDEINRLPQTEIASCQ